MIVIIHSFSIYCFTEKQGEIAKHIIIFWVRCHLQLQLFTCIHEEKILFLAFVLCMINLWLLREVQYAAKICYMLFA